MTLKSELKQAIERNTKYKVKKVNSMQVVKAYDIKTGKFEKVMWIDIKLK